MLLREVADRGGALGVEAQVVEALAGGAPRELAPAEVECPLPHGWLPWGRSDKRPWQPGGRSEHAVRAHLGERPEALRPPLPLGPVLAIEEVRPAPQVREVLALVGEAHLDGDLRRRAEQVHRQRAAVAREVVDEDRRQPIAALLSLALGPGSRAALGLARSERAGPRAESSSAAAQRRVPAPGEIARPPSQARITAPN